MPRPSLVRVVAVALAASPSAAALAAVQQYEVSIVQRLADSALKPITSAGPLTGITVTPGSTEQAAPSGTGTAPAGTLRATPAVPAGAVPTGGGSSRTPPPPAGEAAKEPPEAPPAVSRDAVSRMDIPAARAALARINAAREAGNLDEATRNRLEAEEQLLVQRLEDLNR